MAFRFSGTTGSKAPLTVFGERQFDNLVLLAQSEAGWAEKRKGAVAVADVMGFIEDGGQLLLVVVLVLVLVLVLFSILFVEMRYLLLQYAMVFFIGKEARGKEARLCVPQYFLGGKRYRAPPQAKELHKNRMAHLYSQREPVTSSESATRSGLGCLLV